MSPEGLIIVVPVLLLALVSVFFLRASRRRSGGWPQVQGRVMSARMGESATGNATSYFPILSVAYAANGQTWQAENLAVARESFNDRARVQSLLAGAYATGASVTLAHDPANPARVMIV